MAVEEFEKTLGIYEARFQMPIGNVSMMAQILEGYWVATQTGYWLNTEGLLFTWKGLGSLTSRAARSRTGTPLEEMSEEASEGSTAAT